MTVLKMMCNTARNPRVNMLRDIIDNGPRRCAVRLIGRIIHE